MFEVEYLRMLQTATAKFSLDGAQITEVENRMVGFVVSPRVATHYRFSMFF